MNNCTQCTYKYLSTDNLILEFCLLNNMSYMHGFICFCYHLIFNIFESYKYIYIYRFNTWLHFKLLCDLYLYKKITFWNVLTHKNYNKSAKIFNNSLDKSKYLGRRIIVYKNLHKAYQYRLSHTAKNQIKRD